MSPEVAAIVPMKGHSERVPRKNFRSFNGAPLYQWILATLEDATNVDSIVVDTDSQELKDGVLQQFDVTVIDRPDHLQGDFVPMNDVLLHDVSEVRADVYLQTHCTNPLLRPETIDDAISAFVRDETHDSLFSVTPIRTRFWDENVAPVNHERDELKRTQDLPPLLEENSNVYLFSEDSIRRRENRIGDEPMVFEMDEHEAVDIDDRVDFAFAEFLHRTAYGNEPDPKTISDRPFDLEGVMAE